VFGAMRFVGVVVSSVADGVKHVVALAAPVQIAESVIGPDIVFMAGSAPRGGRSDECQQYQSPNVHHPGRKIDAQISVGLIELQGPPFESHRATVAVNVDAI